VIVPRWHDGEVATEYLEHDGKLYELASFYALPDDAWSIELVEMSAEGGVLAHVLAPDEDIDRPCQVLHLDGESIPSEILRRLIMEVAETSRHAGVSFERSRKPQP
jgi:hypothetical protein